VFSSLFENGQVNVWQVFFENLGFSRGNVFRVLLNLEVATNLTVSTSGFQIFSMSRYSAFNKIFAHKGPYLWTNLSWNMKVQRVSEISILSPLLIHDHFKNQTVPKWDQFISPAPSITAKKVYLCSRKAPLAQVTITFLKPGISFFVLWQLRLRPFSFKGEGETVVPEKNEH
jgi:hypothetical protein